MTIRSLIRILLQLLIGWIFILSPGLFNQWSVLQNAGGYRRAEFVVTGTNCISGGSGGRGQASSPNCFLTGNVLLDGRSIREEFSVGSTLPPDRPVGSRFAVLYNPGMPAFGVNYLNQRVLEAAGNNDPAAHARRWLWTAARMILLSLGIAILIHVLLRMSMRRFSDPPRRLAVDLGGGPAGLGTLLFSLGLSFLAAQIPDPAWGGIVFGMILTAVGAPMLIRSFLVLSKEDGRATRGYHLLGLAFRRQSRPLPRITRVRLERSGKRSAIVMTGPEGIETIRGSETEASNQKAGSRLADFFGVSLETYSPSQGVQKDQVRVRWRGCLRGLVGAMIPLSFIAALVVIAGSSIIRVPGTRLSLATDVLGPTGNLRQVGFLRRWALDQLVNDPSPAALLELLRLLNTVDDVRFPEIAADVDAAAMRRSGLIPSPEQDREAQVGAVNSWAAAHLGRPLDANGGVLGWMPVSERFVNAINAITSQNLSTAWLEWTHFAAGVLNSPEQFLYAVGSALGDPRAIHFAITRAGASFEGQPVPITSRPDVLAHTVGEALALRLWLYEGVGDNAFPEDFGAWWAKWARDHRLPPLPSEPAER